MLQTTHASSGCTVHRFPATPFQGSGNASSLTMSSREIAALTEKQHAHVMRDIRNMLEVLEKDVSSFGSIFKDAYGREQREFLLPKDLTLTLVTGYDVKRRHAINVRWLELEAAAAQPALNPANFTRMQLIDMAREAEAERLVLENKVGKLETAVSQIIQTLQDALRPDTGEPRQPPSPAFQGAVPPAPSGKLVSFEFDGHTVRFLTDAAGKRRFVGKDVCHALGHKQHGQVINAFCRDVPAMYHRILTNRGMQPFRLLSETDVSALIERSKSPSASVFREHIPC